MFNKIKNNVFYRSTIILLLGGILTKCTGFIIKLIITRKIGTYGIGLYSMLSPTISLLTVISVLSYPSSLSKIVSENKYSNKSLFLSILPFSILINIIVILITIVFAPYLANNLLKESTLYYPIICVSLTLPFISVSSIIKGYFWGKQTMFPYMLSNFLEQITRLILIGIFITKFISIGLTETICFIILINIIGEIVSQIIMIKFIRKKYFNLSEIKINKREIIEVMSISIPSTSSKLIGSFFYLWDMK